MITAFYSNIIYRNCWNGFLFGTESKKSTLYLNGWKKVKNFNNKSLFNIFFSVLSFFIYAKEKNKDMCIMPGECGLWRTVYKAGSGLKHTWASTNSTSTN